VGALEERFWHEVCDVAGLPQHRDNHLAPEKQDEIRLDLAAYFACLSRNEVERCFAGRDACVSPVLTYEEMLASPHAQSRGFLADRRPEESIPDLALAAVVDGQRLPIAGTAPRQGQDASDILGELGFDTSGRNHKYDYQMENRDSVAKP
jgi:crotonobetainyl-CoA:carnitine CoA-transferase CaiB-like acyl-CoA transferase